MQVKFEGAAELKQKLDVLADPKIAKRIARKASRQAMNIVRDAARQNAKNLDDPEDNKEIFKNIAVQGGKSKNKGSVVMRVGVRGGASFTNKNPPSLSGGDTRHWRFVEFGTSKSMAFPFMRPALANNIDAVTNKFTEVFKAEIDSELSKR